MCTGKEAFANRQKTKEENLTLSQTKQEVSSSKVKGAPNEENPVEKKEDFVKFSDIPESAREKNGGFFGFFNKSSVSARMAPEDGKGEEELQEDTELKDQQPKQIDSQQKTGKEENQQPGQMDPQEKTEQKEQPKEKHLRWSEKAIIDLDEKERGGASVQYMRASKAFLVERTKADLAKERPVPLSDFIKELLKNLQTLGMKDESLFTRTSKKKAARKEESEAAEKCLPFLQSYMDDTDRLEANPKDAAFAEEYQRKYGQFSAEEHGILRIYAMHLSDVRGTLDTKGAQCRRVTDGEMKNTAAKKINETGPEGTFTDLSEIKYEDRSSEPLFKHRPCIYDMKQGNLGNCYMIAALVSIVDRNPDVITSCMRDDGNTVTVRFFKRGEPVYITVDKTVPYREYTGTDKDGNPISGKEYYGSQGAFWTCLFEKAYAVFAAGNSYSGLGKQGEEGARNVIYSLTGERAETESLPGNMLETRRDLLNELPKEKTIKETLHDMRKYQRAQFEEKLRKEGRLPSSKKEINLLWNREKAKLFFGISDEAYTSDVAEMFRKNKIFTDWRKFFESKLKNFSDDKLRSLTELQTVLDTIKENEVPKLNIPGVDEKTARRTYLSQLVKYFGEKQPLFSIGCNYTYNEDEEEFFNRIKEARKNGMYITTGTSKFRFQGLRNKGVESGIGGVYSNHAYAILGTKEKEVTVGGKKRLRKFIIVSNPWQRAGRLYNSTGVGYEAVTETDQNGNVLYDNHGIFLMELKDFRHTFASIEYQ